MSLTKVSYSMITGAPINVLDYGAYNDGTHANETTAAFQAAFAVAKAANGGRIVAPYGTYLFNDGFGTNTSDPNDFCNNIEIDGCGSTFLCDYANVSGMLFINLEGTNNAVRNIVFDSGHTYPMDVNPFTDGPRDKYINAIVIGGKNATYSQLVDTLANYKEFATVENCTFNYINSPILIEQVSHGLIKNNRINYWTQTAITVWNCPNDVIITDNQLQYGYDDAIYLFLCKAGTPSVPGSGEASAWVAAGRPAGNHKVVNNYLAWTRATCFGTSGYSDVIFANNHCYESLLNNIYINSNPNVWANGELYNKNITIIGNLLEYGGGYWHPDSPNPYFNGPVDQYCSSIGFKYYDGGIPPRSVHIIGNTFVAPVQNGVQAEFVEKLTIQGNIFIAGKNPYNNGTTQQFAVATDAVTYDVVISDNKIIGDQSVTWLATYFIQDNGASNDIRIMRNYTVGAGESFWTGNLATNAAINYDPIPSNNYSFSRYNYAGTSAPLLADFLILGESASFAVYRGGSGTPNAADATVKVRNNGITSRSINASGTVNASGADYAEYMTKAGDFTIAKGDICGIDANGKLTNVFADAVTFVVKSTAPSYVGGDNWANIQTWVDRNSMTADERSKYSKDELEKMLELTDEERDLLEQQRQSVDRIAFAGQVPVNVYGASPQQYIVPVDDGGAIKGVPVDKPTFEQYQIAVGKVIAIEEDGRARIIVKTS